MTHKPTALTWLARLTATAGGVGYIPIAPGTWGTAVGAIITALLCNLPILPFLVLIVVVIGIGSWAAQAADRSWGTHDSGRIVIDEVAGYFVTVAFFDRSDFVVLLWGFVLFRIFDIVKPPPIRWLDQNLPGGFGVVFDDVAAGVFSAVALAAFHWVGLVG